MRILHIDKYGSRAKGGATAHMLDLVHGQRAVGHTVDYFSTSDSANEPSDLARYHLPHPGLNGEGSARIQVRTAAEMIWSRRARRHLAAALDLYQPDVVHLHNVYHQLSPSILPEIAGRGFPTVMTVHDYKLVCPAYRLLDGSESHCTRCVEGSALHVVARRCVRRSLRASALVGVESVTHRAISAYKSVDRFICPSRTIADLLERGGYQPERIQVLGNGIEIPPDDGLAAANRRGVLFAGRLSPEKGVDLLIRAVGQAPTLDLLVAGSGPSREELEALARDVAPQQVRFVGHLEPAALRSRMQQAALLCVPSVWMENQPLVILEAFASRLPVIAGDSEALRELVGPERGATVDPTDTTALGATLTELHTDITRREALGREARFYVESSHDRMAQINRIETMYASLIR